VAVAYPIIQGFLPSGRIQYGAAGSRNYCYPQNVAGIAGKTARKTQEGRKSGRREIDEPKFAYGFEHEED